jgi:hypothetical protein
MTDWLTDRDRQTDWLTDHMDQSLSWEANNHSASQETSAFYGSWRVFNIFMTAHHWFLTWAEQSHQWPLDIIYDILSPINFTLLNAELIP